MAAGTRAGVPRTAAPASAPRRRRRPPAGRTGPRNRGRPPGRAARRRRRQGPPSPPACPGRGAPRPASPSCGPGPAGVARGRGRPAVRPSRPPLSDSTISQVSPCRISHRFESAENGDPYCMDAITDVPLPANEPIHEYAPGSGERARLTDALQTVAAEPIDLPHVIGGAHRMGGGTRTDVVQPHRHCRAAGHLHQRRALRRDRGHRGRDGRQGRLGGHPVRRTRRGLPARRRPAGRSVAGEAVRGDHARPVQVRLPGRDRRGVRADRLLAVQRRLRPSDPGPAADQCARRLEPHRLPAAGGFRLRHHAVQLHRHRRPTCRARPR